MTTKYFYVEWDTSRNVDMLQNISGLSVTAGAAKTFKFRVFYPRDAPENSLPPKTKDWVIRHPSSTNSPDAARVAMVSQAIGDRKLHAKSSDTVVLVSKDELRLAELESILKANSSASIVTVSTRNGTFLDCFDHICRECSIVFKDFFERDQHERFTHSLLCDNPNCDRSKKENGFDTKDKLIEHVSKQRKCEQCVGSGTVLKFCSVSKKDEHVRLVHSKSRVSRLSRTITSPPATIDLERDSGNVIHFRYGQCPLQCSINSACVQRFCTTEDQVKHHVTTHDAKFPYVCALCTAKEFSRELAFRSKARLVAHGKSFGHKQEELILQRWPGNKKDDFP